MIVFLAALLMILGLIGRMVYLMVFDAEYYQKKAEDLHERERKIKAARGEIIDTNGTVLATNRTVCTISVIHSQIKEPEVVIKKLSKCLGMEEAEVRKRVEKVSSMERIKTNVDKETGDKIREMELAGVNEDEDFKVTKLNVKVCRMPVATTIGEGQAYTENVWSDDLTI